MYSRGRAIGRAIGRKRRNKYKPLNSHIKGYSAHHLYIESDSHFCVYVPEFLHRFYYHNSKNGYGMDTMNAIALSFFINESQLF